LHSTWLEIFDAYDRWIARVDFADEHTAYFGAAFGDRSKAAHDFGRQAIDHV